MTEFIPCPDDMPCDRLTSSHRRIAYYKCVNATKVISALGGIVAFLLLTIGLSDSHGSDFPIIEKILAPLTDSNSKALFLIAYLAAIAIHHLRIFFGISYAEYTIEITTHLGARYSAERLFKLFFLVTYPFFAALVKTDHTNWIVLIWAAQILIMIIYDILFWDKLKETAGGGAACVLISDFLTALVLMIYTWPGFFVHIFGIDTFASVAAFVLILVWLVLSCIEFWVVYRKGVVETFRDLIRFIRGDY